MDILNRKLLSNGDSCYFYVSSVESPYFYLRFEGIVREIHTLKEEQVVYRIEPIRILENDSTIHTYINRSSYRVFDLSRKVNQTKTFYTFDLSNVSDFIRKRVHDKYLFECPSASVFDNEKDMDENFTNLNEYIKKLLSDTIKVLNDRK